MPPTPPERPSSAESDTPLSYQRISAGVSQQELADAVGVSVRTIQRLETGATPFPSLRLLINCAIALRVNLQQVCQPEWLQWTAFTEGNYGPPEAEDFLKPGRLIPPKRFAVKPAER